MAETFADLMREAGLRPAWEGVANERPRRPMPRQMRTPYQRLADDRLSAAERGRAADQMRATMEAERATGLGQAQAPQGQNQIRETGQQIASLAGEATGLAPALRANQALRESDYGRFAGETAMGLLNLGTLGLAPRSGAPMRAAQAIPDPPLFGRASEMSAAPTWERTSQGGVLPVRPQADRTFRRTAATSADLRGAADGVFTRTPPRGNGRPDPVTEEPGIGAIRAYHGSPHDFAPEPGAPLGRFSMSRIGTGEGAQAYGHGLYFAENEGVAADYRRRLAGVEDIAEFRLGSLRLTPRNSFDYSPRGSSNYENIRSSLAEDALIHQADMTADPARAQQFVLQLLDDRIKNMPREWPEGLPAANQLRNDLARPGAVSLRLGEQPGRMYQVDIHADPSEFLDWDAPLVQQPEGVRRGIAQSVSGGDDLVRELLGDMSDPNAMPLAGLFPRSRGSQVYNTLVGSSPELGAIGTQRLSSAGIPGIRYLDQGSRGVPAQQWRVSEPGSNTIAALFDNESAARAFAAQHGGDVTQTTNQLSRNYVLFRDDIVEIIRKYGLAGLGMTPAALAASEPQGR